MKDLDLTTLRLFVEVCDSQSIKRVAERERIDASAITKRLAKLELQLQTPLLKRVRQGVQPTPDGALFSEHARHLVQEAQRIALQVTNKQIGFSGMLTIASNRSNAGAYLVDDLALFMQQFEQQHVQIVVNDMMSKDVVQSVREGKSSLGIIWDNTETSDLQHVPYHDDQIAAVMKLNHPLADRSSLTFEEVAQHELIGTKFTRHSAARIRLIGGDRVDKLRFRAEMGTYEGALRMTAHGLGILICPTSIAKVYAQQWDLSIVPLSNPWARQITKIIFKTSLLDRVTRQLIDHLAHQASSQKTQP